MERRCSAVLLFKKRTIFSELTDIVLGHSLRLGQTPCTPPLPLNKQPLPSKNTQNTLLQWRSCCPRDRNGPVPAAINQRLIHSPVVFLSFVLKTIIEETYAYFKYNLCVFYFILWQQLRPNIIYFLLKQKHTITFYTRWFEMLEKMSTPVLLTRVFPLSALISRKNLTLFHTWKIQSSKDSQNNLTLTV